MATMPAGQAVVEILRAEGVEYVFGVVGSAFLEIMDAMYGLEDLKFVGPSRYGSINHAATGQSSSSNCTQQSFNGVEFPTLRVIC